jgi:protein translocase SecG subunit
MQDFLLAAGDSDGLSLLRNALFVLFAILSCGIIIFVLFRHTDTQGLGGAFGAGAVGGEGAFGAKSHKVADKVIAWMCGIFLVLSLIIANVSSRHATLAVDLKTPEPTENTNQ